MRIAIDARFINPENRGLSCYTKNLIFNLAKIDKENEYLLLLRERDCATLDFPSPRFKKIKAEAQWYGVKEQLAIPSILAKLNPDITHFPHFNVPVIYNRPFITTIHDLILFTFPTKRATTLGPLKYAVKNSAYRFTINHALKKSRSIIAVSRNTAKDIQKIFPHVNPQKIHTIYEGAGGEDNDQIEKYKNYSSKERKLWLKNKLGVNSAYIFYLGGAYPHKNLERLVLAFDKAKRKQKFDKNLSLIIAGGDDYFFNQLKKLTNRMNIPNIIFPGFILERKTLEFLYQEALFCIFPSLYEGFGLPPLEAFKRKKLVLCHKGTCFPEILGKSALYFNGNSVQNISETVIETIKNLDHLEKIYLPRAKKTIRKYSWEKMARETLDLYKQV